MNTYINKNYLIAENTIINYTGISSIIDVPERFENIRLMKIGKSAFSELDMVEYLNLPYGIEAIGDLAFSDNHNMKCIRIPGTVRHFGLNAFLGCTQLDEIIIYDIKIDKNTYQALKDNSLKTIDNIFISEALPEFIINTGFKKASNLPATVVPKDIPVLFRFDNISNGYKKEDLFKDVTVFRFVENDNLTNEDAAFDYQRKTNSFGKISQTAEKMNDSVVRTNNKLSRERTCIFTFDDSLTKEINENVFITASIKFGYFFWQSCQKVICNKTDYYVYRRLFLSSIKELEFVKEDVAIYKDSELLSDEKEAQQVYGKYKLLSIL